jgi:hypothetical protein
MENLGTLGMEVAIAETFQAANLHLGAEPNVARRLENLHSEPRPIWLSALEATSCRAQSRGEHHPIRWLHVRGRATYTNLGSDEERIEPLGVCVPRGKTVAVSWLPGKTEYTVEIYKQ